MAVPLNVNSLAPLPSAVSLLAASPETSMMLDPLALAVNSSAAIACATTFDEPLAPTAVSACV
ncbi:MAG: hypothetical protein QM765_25950 [Myxococcales bacterium]